MRVLLSESEIQTRVKELGNSISKDFAGKDILLLGILKGSFLFLADLARCIDCNTEIQFLQATSYGASTKSSGHVNLFYDEKTTVAKDIGNSYIFEPEIFHEVTNIESGTRWSLILFLTYENICDDYNNKTLF